MLRQTILPDFSDFRPNFFALQPDEMKILFCNGDMGNKLYEVIFLYLRSKKLELMKQIHLFKKSFVIFLKSILEDLLSIRFKPHQAVSYFKQHLASFLEFNGHAWC